MSDVRVHVERARPRCPFCHDDVSAGLAWLCPGCGAAHHAACHEEQGGCAAGCPDGAGRQPAPRDVVDPAPKIVPDDDPGALELRRRELLRLGFDVEQRGPDELVATSARWSYDPLSLPAPHRVVVRRVETLTLEPLGDAFLSMGPDAPITVFVFLADEVDPNARSFIAAGHGTDLMFERPRVLFAAWCRGEGLYFRKTPVLGLLRLPGLRFLARRVLFPQLTERAAREPARGTLLVLLVLATALLLALVVAASTVGPAA